jgi:hypothetical protein
VQCSVAHIEALGKPRRLEPVAAFVDENEYNYSSSQCCDFKIVCGILEFLDRVTRNCRPHSMLFTDILLLFVWNMPEIGFVGTAVS